MTSFVTNSLQKLKVVCISRRSFPAYTCKSDSEESFHTEIMSGLGSKRIRVYRVAHLVAEHYLLTSNSVQSQDEPLIIKHILNLKSPHHKLVRDQMGYPVGGIWIFTRETHSMHKLSVLPILLFHFTVALLHLLLSFWLPIRKLESGRAQRIGMECWQSKLISSPNLRS